MRRKITNFLRIDNRGSRVENGSGHLFCRFRLLPVIRSGVNVHRCRYIGVPDIYLSIFDIRSGVDQDGNAGCPQTVQCQTTIDEKIRPREKAKKAEEKAEAEKKAAEEKKTKRAAEAEMRRQKKMTEFSDLPNDMHNMEISWEFTVNDNGIFVDIEHKDYSERKQISRTPMLITRQIADPEGDKERRSDGKPKQLELAYKDGGRWRTTLTTLAILTDVRKMDQLKGFISGIDNENFQHLARFFDAQYKLANGRPYASDAFDAGSYGMG